MVDSQKILDSTVNELLAGLAIYILTLGAYLTHFVHVS